MVRIINKRVTIDEYKFQNVNTGKVAIYDFKKNMVIKEGDAEDWYELQTELEGLKTDESDRYTMILTHSNKVINGFWSVK